MGYLRRIALGTGWIVVFIGGCVLLYPVFSLLARVGVRSLDETLAGTYVLTGSLLHLPVILVLGFVIVMAGFDVLGRVDQRAVTEPDPTEDSRYE